MEQVTGLLEPQEAGGWLVQLQVDVGNRLSTL